MKPAKLATLKFFALLLLLPGLAGLVLSAVISTHYLDTMPRLPVMEDGRDVPREIHGTTVYQTPAESQKLNLIEYSSVGVFLIGLVLGIVYLEQWGSMQAHADDESDLAKNYR